ncbi:MAG: hypothetical protein BWY74_03821 [Firmicutes bacterium ADurb.Bin419]|nr:MAG: hypothetical protein BWY74_03821 [Firmicutes bacterium ADurb.Bin419]
MNIFAEFALYGQSMAPSLYGSYINGAYFSFGKAYPSIAGGNGIALDTVIGIALCIILLMEKKTSHKVFYLVSIAFFAYCGMLCVARAFYIEIIVLVILIILSQFRRPLRLFGLLFIIGAIAFILINGFSDYFKPLIQAVEIRFNQGNESRVYLINAAQRVLETEPLVLLFGAGTYYPDIFGFTAHNIFYDILVSLGVLGTLIYSIAFIKCIVKVIWRSGKFNLLFSAPLLMFLTYKLISGSTRDVPFYYMMALILIFYRRMNTHRGNSL